MWLFVWCLIWQCWARHFAMTRQNKKVFSRHFRHSTSSIILPASSYHRLMPFADGKAMTSFLLRLTEVQVVSLETRLKQTMHLVLLLMKFDVYPAPSGIPHYDPSSHIQRVTCIFKCLILAKVCHIVYPSIPGTTFKLFQWHL